MLGKLKVPDLISGITVDVVTSLALLENAPKLKTQSFHKINPKPQTNTKKGNDDPWQYWEGLNNNSNNRNPQTKKEACGIWVSCKEAYVLASPLILSSCISTFEENDQWRTCQVACGEHSLSFAYTPVLRNSLLCTYRFFAVWSGDREWQRILYFFLLNDMLKFKFQGILVPFHNTVQW